MTDPAAAPLAPDAPPDWRTFARAGEWRRALAAARLTSAPPEVAGALEDVFRLQEAVRARRIPRARQVWEGLRETLSSAQAQGLAGEAALLQTLIRPEALGQALTALEAARRGPGSETEPEALRERLAPALAHPLTRAEAFNALGVLHALHGEEAEARTAFADALAVDAAHYRALTNLGNLELEAGQLAQAEAHYREALRLNPEFDGAHHNLAVSLRRQGKVHESVGAIRRAQRLSVKRAREDSREDFGQQLRQTPHLRLLPLVALAAVALLLFLLLRGAGS